MPIPPSTPSAPIDKPTDDPTVGLTEWANAPFTQVPQFALDDTFIGYVRVADEEGVPLDAGEIVVQMMTVVEGEGEDPDEVFVEDRYTIELDLLPVRWCVAGEAIVDQEDLESGSTDVEDPEEPDPLDSAERLRRLDQEYRLVIAYFTLDNEVRLEYFTLRLAQSYGVRNHRKLPPSRIGASEATHFHTLVMDYDAERDKVWMAFTRRDITMEDYELGIEPTRVELAVWDVRIGRWFVTPGPPTVDSGSGGWLGFPLPLNAEVASIFAPRSMGRSPVVVFNEFGNSVPFHRLLDEPPEFVDGVVRGFISGRGFFDIAPGTAGQGLYAGYLDPRQEEVDGEGVVDARGEPVLVAGSDRERYLLPVQERDADLTGHVYLYEVLLTTNFHPDVMQVMDGLDTSVPLEVLTVYGSANWRPTGMRVARMEIPQPVDPLEALEGLGFGLSVLDLILFSLGAELAEGTATEYLMITASVPDQPSDAEQPRSFPSFAQLVDLGADLVPEGFDSIEEYEESLAEGEEGEIPQGAAVIGPILYTGHGDTFSVVAMGDRIFGILNARRDDDELYSDEADVLVPVPREERGIMLRLPEPVDATPEEAFEAEAPTELVGDIEFFFL